MVRVPEACWPRGHLGSINLEPCKNEGVVKNVFCFVLVKLSDIASRYHLVRYVFCALR